MKKVYLIERDGHTERVYSSKKKAIEYLRNIYNKLINHDYYVPDCEVNGINYSEDCKITPTIAYLQWCLVGVVHHEIIVREIEIS